MWIWAGFSFFLSWVLQYFYWSSSSWGITDLPNHRSLHTHPTKKSAGFIFLGIPLLLSLVYGAFVGLGWIPGSSFISSSGLLAFGIGILFFFGIGYWDDQKGLGSVFRLGLELAFLSGLTFFFPFNATFLGLSHNSFLFLFPFFAVFFVNLCNFMDGLDLYLVSTAFFAGWVLLFFLLPFGLEKTPFWVALMLFASGILGFVFWNAPPARLFMGDVGSLPIGFFLLGLPWFFSWEISKTQPAPHFPWDLSYYFFLFPVFWVDGVLTILVRILRKENPMKAHREHLYQILVQLGWGKGMTTLVFASVNFPGIFANWLLEQEKWEASHRFFLILGVYVLVFGILRWILFPKLQRLSKESVL